jgi:peptide/nickel transport system permease protein
MRREQSEKLVSQEFKKNSLFVESMRRIMSNPGAVFGFCLLLLLLLLMVYSFFFISTEQVTMINSANRLQPPSKEHVFGTDGMGRDMTELVTSIENWAVQKS